MIVTGLADTASATVAARRAPSATRASPFSAVRFQIVKGCPWVRSALASARPIGPSPMTVTGVRSWPEESGFVMTDRLDPHIDVRVKPMRRRFHADRRVVPTHRGQRALVAVLRGAGLAAAGAAAQR